MSFMTIMIRRSATSWYTGTMCMRRGAIPTRAAAAPSPLASEVATQASAGTTA